MTLSRLVEEVEHLLEITSVEEMAASELSEDKVSQYCLHHVVGVVSVVLQLFVDDVVKHCTGLDSNADSEQLAKSEKFQKGMRGDYDQAKIDGVTKEMKEMLKKDSANGKDGQVQVGGY